MLAVGGGTDGADIIVVAVLELLSLNTLKAFILVLSLGHHDLTIGADRALAGIGVVLIVKFPQFDDTVVC